jgi:hypothetical protein
MGFEKWQEPSSDKGVHKHDFGNLTTCGFLRLHIKNYQPSKYGETVS